MYIYVYMCIYIHTHVTGQKDIQDLLCLAARHVFQGIFFKANCQRPELWIVKKKLKFYMKINFEMKKGYRNVDNKNRFKNANSDLSEGC